MHKTTLSYNLKGSRKINSKNQRTAKANKGELVVLLECPVCGSKKSRFIKD